MRDHDRRGMLKLGIVGLGAAVLAPALPAAAEPRARLTLMTGASGSVLLPYGLGLAKVVERAGVADVEVLESPGSAINMARVEAEVATLGMVFLGSLHQGRSATPEAPSRLRALLAMYPIAFMGITMKSSGVASLRQLENKRVGTGHEGGPADQLFRELAAEARIAATIVPGEPFDNVRQLQAGEIDAVWHGAALPVPTLAAIADAAEATPFGLNSFEIARLRKRLPYLQETLVPVGTYRGQDREIRTVSAWNVVAANVALPEALAYEVTRAVLSAADLAEFAGPAAKATVARNAPINTILPYHVGAARALKELGVQVTAEP